ncbi:MAG: DEAD/DEAH box helicase [Pseudomonadales bacterium]|nr:DEAD/DEAH box helicase [Pseudomonadales bacterium]
MFSSLSIDSRLQKATDSLGYTELTPVQAQSIPRALEGKDLVVGANTGTGKTVAFLIPALQKLLAKDAPQTGTRALILVPTRELARQVSKHLQQLARFTHLKYALIVGGEEFKFQQALIRKNPEFLIATPGRLAEHVRKGSVDLNDLEVLILDEADQMLDQGLGEDVLAITEQCAATRQTLLYSATMRNKNLGEMIQQVLNDPESLILNADRQLNSELRHQIIVADDSHHKTQLVSWLLEQETYSKAIIFANTKVQADSLAGKLRYRGLKAGILHGDLSQEIRTHVTQQMKNGSINILVASDVAARGLDIKDLDLVINFDVPRSGDEYTHRVGRSGRAGASGLAISLVSASEWNLMASISRYLKLETQPRVIKALEGKYKGPAKVKSSGKAAGKKKKPASGKKKSDKNQKKRSSPGTSGQSSGKNPSHSRQHGEGTQSRGEGTPSRRAPTKAGSENTSGDGFGLIRKKK